MTTTDGVRARPAPVRASAATRVEGEAVGVGGRRLGRTREGGGTSTTTPFHHPVRRAPTAVHSPLARLLRGIGTAMADHRDPAEQAQAVAAVLAPALGDRRLLGPHHLLSSPDSYRTNVVHVAPDGAFSLVALVWRPGQRTPVHSHRSWCVVGVHQGHEREVEYEVAPGAGLRATTSRVHRPRDVTWLAAGDAGIHSVENAGHRLAVSIHVYALDYRAANSSILDTFTVGPPV